MSQSIDSLKIDCALDEICELGCLTVREVIQEIERGILPEPAKRLNAKECEYLLVELKSVMKTYQ